MADLDKDQALDTLQVLTIGETKYKTRLTKKFLSRKQYQPPNPKCIISHIPGTIKELLIKEGDMVKIGDELLNFEAMKMLNTITAPMDGEIAKIMVKSGQIVAKNVLLIEFK